MRTDTKLTAQKALNLCEALDLLQNERSSAKFALAAALNRAEAGKIADGVRKAMGKPSEKVVLFQQEYAETVNRLALRDEDKNVRRNGDKIMLPSTPEVRAELDAIEQRHAEAIRETSEREAKIAEMMAEMVTVGLILVPIDIIPPVVTPAIVAKLMPMLDLSSMA